MVLTGDYWLIPARTETADIEWKQHGNQPAKLPPFGLDYSFAPLALVHVNASGKLTVTDLRKRFSPLAGQIQLFYLGGDGQEFTDKDWLPQPVEVSVSHHCGPLPKVKVLYRAEASGLRLLSSPKGYAGTSVFRHYSIF